jgi:copper homeostasis protein (lipoprotein)
MVAPYSRDSRILLPCSSSGLIGVLMRITVAAACVLMLVGCNREEPTPSLAPSKSAAEVEAPPVVDTSPTSLESLPARYSGVLPCADCTGIRFDIDLRPANVYFLRMTYLGVTPERVYDDIGAWSLASDLRTLALRGARQSPMLFSITNTNTLRKLDTEGQTIESELNYSVARSEKYEPLAPVVPLRGMYSLTANGALLEECTTGLKLQIEGAQTESLATEFAKARGTAARPVLLAVEGKIDSLESADASAHGKLTATSAAKFWAGESCGARGVTHDLEGSRWVLVRIGDKAVMAQEGRAEPYIVLQTTSKQVAGHAGCNRLSGGYTIERDALRLSEITTTRMACPELETENEFLNALETVERWKLMDNQLALFDKSGVQVLQFESRNL